MADLSVTPQSNLLNTSSAKTPVRSPKESKFKDVLTETQSSKSQDTEPTVDRTTAEEESKKSVAATKQAVMNLFFERMQTELGVAPEKVVEAFSKLSIGELMAPPEESAKKLVSLLDLSPEKKEQALGLYTEMLALTAAVSMSQYLNQKDSNADFAVMDKDQARRKAWENTVVQLSDKFFMTGADKIKGLQAYDMQSPKNGEIPPSTVPASRSPASTDNNKEAFLLAGGAAGFTGAAALDTPARTTTDISTEMAALQSHTNGINYATGEAPVFDQRAEMMMQAQPSAMEMNMANQPLDPTMVAPEGLPAIDTSASTDGLTASGADEASLLSATDVQPLRAGITEDSDDNKNNEGDNLGDNLNFGQDNQKISNRSTDKTFVVGVPKPTEAETQGNVKEIISQAQYLIRKGGGEMKVSLNPEGMGEVSLKVKMVNGQVNVEMVTSNNEAKKVLETGLSELRDNLASHKLHLDSIKIENSKEISNQLADQHRDLEQGFQQKFLNDFRERNQSYRNEMFEVGGPRSIGNQTKDKAANTPYNAKRKDSSRRLDLVA